VDGPQEFLADLDRRWLGRPGYLIVELGALLAMMTSATQECAGVWTLVLRLCVEVVTASAMVLGVAFVHTDWLPRARQTRVASILLVASLGLTVGLLIASGACGFAPADPAALAVLAMATGFYIECLWSSD
jgi:uncharacterized membrane-anchored protein